MGPSGDSGGGVSRILFPGINLSLRTQGHRGTRALGALNDLLEPSHALCAVFPMRCFQGAKLSKAYRAEADVWRLARKSSLVIDVATDDDRPSPHPVLDNDYETAPVRRIRMRTPSKIGSSPSARPNASRKSSSGLVRPGALCRSSQLRQPATAPTPRVKPGRPKAPRIPACGAVPGLPLSPSKPCPPDRTGPAHRRPRMAPAPAVRI